jgi:hypothetical protein
VINKLVDIGITNLIFDREGIPANEMRIYEGSKDKLLKYAKECAQEYLISGLVVPEVKFTSVSKDVLVDMGIKKYSTLSLPTSIWLRDPNTIEIKSSMVMDEPSYFVVLPEEVIMFIQNKGTYNDGTKDPLLYAKLLTLYPEFVAQVESGNKAILLTNDLITRRKVNPDSPYPTPYLYNSLEALKHKRNLRRMDYSIAARVISAIQLIKMGNDEYPITEDEEDAFDDLREQMAWRYTAGRDIERVFQLFANHTVSIEWVYPPVDALLNDEKYFEVNQDIFFGLGFPRILTTGETERSGSSDPEFATLSPTKTMEEIQIEILPIIKSIVRNIAKFNGLKNYPNVRFEIINLRDYQNFVSAMQALYNTANISRTSYAKVFGFNWNDEVEKRSEEQEIIEKLDLPEFAPQPFSPTPGNNNKEVPNKKEEPKEPDDSK